MAKMKKKKSSFASVYANYAGPAAGTKVNFIKLESLRFMTEVGEGVGCNYLCQVGLQSESKLEQVFLLILK